MERQEEVLAKEQEKEQIEAMEREQKALEEKIRAFRKEQEAKKERYIAGINAVKQKAEESREPTEIRIPFKLPKWIARKVGKKSYLNHVLVVYLRRNREIELYYTPPSNDLIRIGDLYHDARVDCYYTYGKARVPTLIIEEFNMRPIGTEEYQRALLRGELTDAQDIAIKSFEKMEAENKKKKIDTKTVVFIVIGVIVVAFILAGL